MKLTRIITKGFKSFADNTVINFPDRITGVVGPNGCGKSNIADAIKWVFGEQSAKKLRGSSMDDVIFSGSQSRKATNFAEVSLIFDNSSRKINIDFNEVEITRRIYRGDGANHYFINQEPVRLRDIQEITMDSGLGKGSLGIISQGTVSSFAEAKPEERRVIFEEAANVSKYKKRKVESIRKLQRTQNNLERVSDILFELEKQYKPLKKQAQKAKEYIALRNELQDKEVTLLVHDILKSEKIFDKANQEINAKTEELNSIVDVFEKQSSLSQAKRDAVHELDLKINKLQVDLINLSGQAQNTLKLESIIEYQKNELVQSSDKPQRILQIQKSLPNVIEENKINKEKSIIFEKELNSAKETLKNIYQNQEEINQALYQIDGEINKLEVQKQLTENNLRKNSNLPLGVSSIINSKDAFSGCLGVLQEQIRAHEGYELALASALGRQKHSLVVKTKDDSKDIIKFLKTNKSGFATILPLDMVKEKSINPEALIAAQQSSGYIAPIVDLIDFNSSIAPAINFALGNILVAQDITSAYEISNLTQKRLRVVTSDGQIVNVGGSVTGGHTTPIKSKENLEKLLELIKAKLSDTLSKKNKLRGKTTYINTEIDKTRNHINILASNDLKQKQLLEALKSKIILLSSEYKDLTGNEFNIDQGLAQESFVEYKTQLNQVNFIREEIKTLSEQKNNLLEEWKNLDELTKEQSHEIKGIENIIHNNELIISKEEIKLENHTNRLLSEYKLTFEFAKNKFNDFSNLEAYRHIVSETRNKLDKLGYVNVDAVEQFIEIEERYLKLKEQHEELDSAKTSIVNIINDMDKKMIDDFDQTFNKINQELQNTFSRLFGGGKASLEYSDPTNVLESGIEVKVKPPGKSISNLRLFSGGEKSLIALSVLFAILKVNPIPLVVLDEVEAPLDQVNVERFVDYLNDFANNTQFIVITHRSGTMKKCDNIYGITMQEQGVSKLVSINLQEAEKIAEYSVNK